MATDTALFEEFFQKSKSYYLDKLTKYQSRQKFTFNVFAFLFGIFWFLYRKMYIETIAILVLLILEALFETFILGQDADNMINVIITIASATIIALLANYFYIRKAERTI